MKNRKKTAPPALENTRWSGVPEENNVWKEYPRPAMARDSYWNLNGIWDYRISADSGIPPAYDGTILVPFSPESPLSGVKRQLLPGEYLWYRRRLTLPGDRKGKRVILHFGAVDQECVVYLNGREAGSHAGGYLPFSLDITEYAGDDNELLVRVQDFSDSSYFSRGKQKLEKGGMFYTAQSGIWQTVWMELVPENHIVSVRFTPDYDAACCHILVKASGSSSARIRCGIRPETEEDARRRDDPSLPTASCVPSDTFFLTPGKEYTLPLPDFTAWTPENPFLYHADLDLEEDHVECYFAMRKCDIQTDAAGLRRIFLNNAPYMQTGVLDQGYWPDGLYTAPCDEAFLFDIRSMKELGFNMIRKHIKIEPQRWYYHCDRLGLVVWQDMVNGGSRYNLWFVTYLTNVLQPLVRRLPDAEPLWGLLSRGKASSRETYRKELQATVEALRCHPCIGCWVPFNEGWGQFDAAGAVQAIRTLDDTRLVDEASGWYDQGGGDVCSIHNYFYPLHVKPGSRTVALSEYGGIAWPMPGHEAPGKTYGYGTAKSRADLTARCKKLQLGTVLPQLKKGLSALVYTQLTDVEDEVNGLFTYDRAEIKPDANAVRSVNAALAAEFAKVTR